jgi:hypothetical protein
MAVLGRIPAVGDTVSIPGWDISVVAMDGMRADRLRFVPVPDEDDPDDDPSGGGSGGAARGAQASGGSGSRHGHRRPEAGEDR